MRLVGRGRVGPGLLSVATGLENAKGGTLFAPASQLFYDAESLSDLVKGVNPLVRPILGPVTGKIRLYKPTLCGADFAASGFQVMHLRPGLLAFVPQHCRHLLKSKPEAFPRSG